MSDINTSIATPPATEPIIDPDDIGAQVSAVFEAMGVTEDTVTEPISPAAEPATPDPATDPPTDDTGNPVLDAPEDGIDTRTPEQIAAEALAAPDASAATPPPDPTANLIDLGDGVVVDREEAARLINWANSLDPTQVAAVERVLADPSAASGSGTPVPAYTQPVPGVSPYSPQPPYQSYPAYPPSTPVGQPGAPIYPPVAPQPGAMPQPYPQPSPVAPYQPIAQPSPYSQQSPVPALDPRAALGALTEIAPELGDFLAAQAQQTALLQQQLAANTAYQQQQLAEQAREREAQINSGLDAGRQKFMADHPDLSDVDMHYLTQRVAASQSIAPLVRQHNGDHAAAAHDAFTTAMYSDPTYRTRITQAAMNAQAETSQQIAERREAAAALSGSHGAVGITPQPAPQALPPSQRREALASDIASAIAGA